jgi:hypothetical protein
MLTIIKKGTSIQEVKKLLGKAVNEARKKRLNVERFSGVLKTDIDPLEYQKQIRNEWE